MRFFALYQYVAPAVLFPLAYWLFLCRYQSHTMTWFALAIPIVWSYAIPAIGMNWLRIWSMRTRIKVGKIRPHHGFMFGSASSMFALVCLDPATGEPGMLSALRAGLVLGSVVAFWNWLYDVIAIRVGFIEVFNKPWFEGQGPEAIATDYAPALFGGFGFVYGVWLRVGECWLLARGRTDLFWPLLCGALASAMVIPVVLFVAQSLWLRGEIGLRTYQPPDGPE